MRARSRSALLDRLFWRLTAPVYDRLARPLGPGRAWVGDSLDLTGDDRVLLLGCGTGLDLEHLPSGAAAVAVDRSPPMVRRCRRRGAALDLDLEASVADAADVPRPDDSFDAVLVHLLLSVVDDPDAVLAEAARVLADGGRLSILDERTHPASDPAHDRHESSLRAAGLVSERSESFGPYSATIATPMPRRGDPSPPTG